MAEFAFVSPTKWEAFFGPNWRRIAAFLEVIQNTTPKNGDLIEFVDDRWKYLKTPAPVVASVAGRTGNVTVTKDDVGLAFADNTPDSEKPVSGPQQAALAEKASAAALAAHLADTKQHSGAGISAAEAAAIAAAAAQGALATGLAALTPADVGVRSARVRIPSVEAGKSALVTVTWPAPFADANYTVTASTFVTGLPAQALSVLYIESATASQAKVRVQNNAAVAAAGDLHAIAVHD